MAGYDQTIRVKAAHRSAAKSFFGFLQNVGRKYERPTRINYRYLGRGRFYVTVDGSPGGIDALFQELILHRGLHYYACSIRGGSRRDILRHAVIPIFQQLLEERFPNPYSRFLRRHLTGKVLLEEYVPGEFANQFAHRFEVLFRKWDIGSLDDWNFIKDLDALLTQFMLTELGHRPGAASPRFHVIVDLTYRKGAGMTPEIKGLFNEIHRARTEGLHRLASNTSKETLTNIAFRTYNYFQYFDEFAESQSVKTEKLHGKRYARIRYGDEVWKDDNGEPFKDEVGNPLDNEVIFRNPCHDCAAVRGQYHCFGCDMEMCARCEGQRLVCGCRLKKDFK